LFGNFREELRNGRGQDKTQWRQRLGGEEFEYWSIGFQIS
jgi:hypothetical protein